MPAPYKPPGTERFGYSNLPRRVPLLFRALTLLVTDRSLDSV
jgi:hypothetical protein